jgi:hypothetical protein
MIETIYISSGKTFTCTTIGGNSVILTRGTGFSDIFFNVSNGGLILGDSRSGAIILDGQTGSPAGELLHVTGAGSVLTINAGVDVWRNKGRGVSVENGSTFTMTGGSIRSNTATNGGGVYVYDSKFTMTGGTIMLNNASNGGGVYMEYGSSEFTMTGGTIIDNTAATYGGGVYARTSLFKMHGGSINGNKAEDSSNTFGGGVFVSSVFEMYGGVISRHRAESSSGKAWGGGVCAWGMGCSFNMYGGTISGNTVKGDSSSSGGGVYRDSFAFTKTPAGGGAASGTIHGSNSTTPNLVTDAGGTRYLDSAGKGHAVYDENGGAPRNREKTIAGNEHTTSGGFWTDP